MKVYTQDELDFIVQRFNNKTLPKSDWTHHAHLIVALWHNLNYPFPRAVELVRNKIKAYNIYVGTQNTDTAGYHETLTVLWMALSKNYIFEHSKLSFQELVNQFLCSEVSQKEVVFQYYSKEVLLSTKARKEWVLGNRDEIKVNLSLNL
ncbi:MAG: hypothetical protein AAF960_26915 [Bacteroidota bacterium]